MEEQNKEKEETQQRKAQKPRRYMPAPPDYGEAPLHQESEEERTPIKSGGESIINKLILIGLSVLISVILIGTFFSPVNKKVYEADITRLETDLVATRTSETGLSDRITGQESKITAAILKGDAMANSLTNYANKAELANYALRGDYVTTATLNEAKNSLATIIQLNSAKADIIAQTALITALQVRIAALEAPTPVLAPTKSSNITATIKTQYLGYIILPQGSSNATVYSYPLKLTVANKGNKDATDIQLAVSFEASNYITQLTWTTEYPQLVGGLTTWSTYAGYYSYGLTFVNGWGLNIKAGDTKTFDLTLYLKFTAPAVTPVTIQWSPDVEVQ